MIYVLCLFGGVFGGLWLALKAESAWQRMKMRTAWDRDTAEALAVANDAADDDDAFDEFMRERWAEQ